MLKSVLSAEGYEVYEASNGEEGIESLIKLCVPNLVIVDTHMPKMDGLTFLNQIRDLWNASILPVIALTGDNSTELLVNYYKSGLNDYITKPFNSRELILRVETQIQLANRNNAMSSFVPNDFLKMMGKKEFEELKIGDFIETEVTILFNDIRNYTMMAEKMSPKDNFKFINAYLKRIVPVIKGNSGFIDKYIGDCVMAIFPHEPEDAVKASIEMVQEINDYNEIRCKGGLQSIKIGIGINTGKMALGVIGDHSRMESTVISDAVNISARLERLTKIYGALSIISENTLTRIKNFKEGDYRFLDEIKVKGKEKSLQIFEILGCVGEGRYKLASRFLLRSLLYW